MCGNHPPLCNILHSKSCASCTALAACVLVYLQATLGAQHEQRYKVGCKQQVGTGSDGRACPCTHTVQTNIDGHTFGASNWLNTRNSEASRVAQARHTPGCRGGHAQRVSGCAPPNSRQVPALCARVRKQGAAINVLQGGTTEGSGGASPLCFLDVHPPHVHANAPSAPQGFARDGSGA